MRKKNIVRRYECWTYDESGEILKEEIIDIVCEGKTFNRGTRDQYTRVSEPTDLQLARTAISKIISLKSQIEIGENDYVILGKGKFADSPLGALRFIGFVDKNNKIEEKI